MGPARRLAGLALTAVISAMAISGGAPAGADEPFLSPLTHVSTVASTVPANGDVNPYGTAVVPKSVGRLHKGSVLVSNFNDSANLQGTGTTLVQVSPDGQRSLFAKIDGAALGNGCPGGVGLTTALAVLGKGWVVVGSLPTTDGMPDTIGAGCLIVLDAGGHVVRTISGDPINGPWDMTAVDHGDHAVLFVTNVLNGTVAAGGATVFHGTVVRLNLDLRRPAPTVTDETVIASGFGERTDPAALVVGPTGVGLGTNGVLYVADTVGNRITAVPDPLGRHETGGTGQVVTAGGSLNAPLGLTTAPNGDIVTVNAGDGNAVETTPAGAQVVTRRLDSSGSPPGSGALFGLAVSADGESLYFVDDATNTLDLLS